MAFKYRCSKGTSRLSLSSRELDRIVDQFVRMNAHGDLSTEEVEQIRWLAVGLFHSPSGLPTTTWIKVNKAAEKRHLEFYIPMTDRECGFEDPLMQRAAANWMLTQRRTPGVYEAVDPAEPSPTPAQQSAA